MKTFKEFASQDAITEGKINYDKLDLGDLEEILTDAFEGLVGSPGAVSLEAVFEGIIKAKAKANLETWEDNDMDIDEGILEDMKNIADGAVKVKVKGL